MRTTLARALFAVLTLSLFAGIFLFISPHSSSESSYSEELYEVSKEGEREREREYETEKELSGELKKARSEYFFKLLRDPATNRIPPNIRARELNRAYRQPSVRQVNNRLKAKNPEFQAAEINWEAAGPLDTGGRTRALAIDPRDPDIILAGGVSGGMWKSTDGGNTWELKTESIQNMSVSSLAQDPRPGQGDTWYYTAGEIDGNSASAQGAFYLGTGLFKSTDNGESWNRVAGSEPVNVRYDSKFDLISRVKVNPVTGSVFICSNGHGVFRSTDGGNTFTTDPVVGTAPASPNGYPSHEHCDIDIASDGTIVAALSTETVDEELFTPPDETGIWVSTDDGDSWTDITPSAFPNVHGRSVISFAPSDSDIFYVFTEKLQDESNQGVSLFRFDLGSGTVSSDRGGNIPDFRDEDDSGSGYMELQGGYNMLVSVKPDNPDFVIVGGTNLFRSRDGFATKPAGGYDSEDQQQINEYWIGGYNRNTNNFGLYPNHHPDQHLLVYHPGNPDIVYSAHDGGLSKTTDITDVPVSWTDMDMGYVTSQFYATAIPAGPNDDRLMGGTQDNGSRFFRYEQGQAASSSIDISLGDGGYSYFGNSYVFVEQQLGRVLRYETTSSGDPISNTFTFVQPEDAEGQLFIHPYTVDPNDETVMYYPVNNILYRNTIIDQIPIQGNQNGTGTDMGWEQLSFVINGFTISALEVSTIPADILYFAGSSDDNPPRIRKVVNASGESSTIDIPIAGAPNGAFVHDIALNPQNADEAMVVMSNYNITGLYHTNDGGANWTAVEANLSGDQVDPGPSIRSAAIIPGVSGTKYVVATSTGLYTTELLDGSNTLWGQESMPDGNGQTSEIGYSVVEHLSSRKSNGDVAVGTHGRGMFLGRFQGTTNFPSITLSPSEAMSGEQVSITSSNFTFGADASQNTVTFGGKQAVIISASAGELTVEVPRDLVSPDAVNDEVQVSVRSNGIETAPATFRLLPPDNFSLKQNYPNPFNPTTVIPFDLATPSRVSITIFDILGQEVYTPVSEQLYNAGTYDIPIEMQNLASGVYIYRVIAKPESGGSARVKVKKMTYIK